MSVVILGPRDRAVYSWEAAHVHPLDRGVVDQRLAESIVRYVWSERGLIGPPRVVHVPRLRGADGTRTQIRIGDCANTATILHELAHSMDESLEVRMGFLEDRPDGESLTGSCHDDNWLGIYLDLLNDFMPPSFNKLWMMKTLQDRGLTFSLCPVIRCR